MILRSNDINKINISLNKIILLYGKNDGYKAETIKKLTKERKNIFNYEQNEILNNEQIFIDNLLTNSLFENEKTLLIKRANDKILNIIKQIEVDQLENIIIIIESDNLDKKSKLRSLFEKDKNLLSIAFYPDNELTLSKLAYNYLKDKNISLSKENINLIISKCNGDRGNLFNELIKIENFIKNSKKITTDDLSKLINISGNHEISELVNHCLAKNKKKIINILNENNFSNEDCILINRALLSKTKKILQLSENYKVNRNIDLTISSAKPPIFWKDKEITKQQIYKWPPKNIRKLIYKINDIELRIKKNFNNSVNLLTDFILETSTTEINNKT